MEESIDLIERDVNKTFKEFSANYHNYIDLSLTEKEYIEQCLIKLHSKFNTFSSDFEGFDLFNLTTLSEVVDKVYEAIHCLHKENGAWLSTKPLDENSEITETGVNPEIDLKLKSLMNKLGILVKVREIVRIIKFLSSNLHKLGHVKYEFTEQGTILYKKDELTDENNTMSGFTWNASQVETVELIKALKYAGALQGTDDTIFKAFYKFLNVESEFSSKPSKIYTDISNRKKNRTVFLDKLKVSLEEKIKSSEDKIM